MMPRNDELHSFVYTSFLLMWPWPWFDDPIRPLCSVNAKLTMRRNFECLIRTSVVARTTVSGISARNSVVITAQTSAIAMLNNPITGMIAKHHSFVSAVTLYTLHTSYTRQIGSSRHTCSSWYLSLELYLTTCLYFGHWYLLGRSIVRLVAKNGNKSKQRSTLWQETFDL